MKVRKIQSDLDNAVEHLHALVKEPSTCALPADVKEKVSNYVESWITPYVESALLELTELCRCGHFFNDHNRREFSCKRPDCQCYHVWTR